VAEPFVSVVIPARDEEDYVAAALESIAAQTWRPRDLEAIVVVNGTEDRTLPVARATAERLGGFPVRLVDDPTAGVSRAKNAGARLARGDLLVFLDADSRMAPDLIEKIVAASERAPAGSIRIVADSDDPIDGAFFRLLEWGKGLFGIHANMLFCSRALFEDVGGFDERLYQAEDLDLLRRIATRGERVTHVADSSIATSPRRLHEGPLRVGLLRVFARWTLGHVGIWRERPY
jgi:glycosyltransferase involved in cell wall biosynthesis